MPNKIRKTPPTSQASAPHKSQEPQATKGRAQTGKFKVGKGKDPALKLGREGKKKPHSFQPSHPSLSHRKASATDSKPLNPLSQTIADLEEQKKRYEKEISEIEDQHNVYRFKGDTDELEQLLVETDAEIKKLKAELNTFQ